MWINCDLEDRWDTEINYKSEDGYFYVEARSSCPAINENTVLSAHFDGEKRQNFEIGNFFTDNGIFKINKKYSLSYLESMDIDIFLLSRFSVELSENEVMDAYPLKTDKSISGAREILKSIRGNTDCRKEAAETINKISENVLNYRQNNLPFLSEYTWYLIDDKAECFSASSIYHVLKSEGFNGSIPPWYFGVSNKDRLYAMAVKCDNKSPNPMSNANDCTMLFADDKNNCIYYVVGIMFLDDGQYFCRLN